MTNSHYDADAGPLLNALGAIQDLIDTKIDTMVFKALHSPTPEYLSDLFIRSSESHLWPLRYTCTDLQLPKTTRDNGLKCFSYRGAKSWNALTLETKQATSLQAFKDKQIQGFLFLIFYTPLYCKLLCKSVYFSSCRTLVFFLLLYCIARQSMVSSKWRAPLQTRYRLSVTLPEQYDNEIERTNCLYKAFISNQIKRLEKQLKTFDSKSRIMEGIFPSSKSNKKEETLCLYELS